MAEKETQGTLTEKSLLMLIDGHALVHRAFHALPPLSVNKTGEPTGAVFGFASALLKSLEELKPSHCAIVFDRPSPTFRHLQYEEYKADRAATPDDLRAQFKRIRELVAAFGIPAFEMDGYEGDDILGTLAHQASEGEMDVIILTGDTDTVQLVSPRVKALMPRGMFSDTVLYDEVKVLERYGVTPSQIADFKGLKGDTSDNIPGVPGIGDKTAAKLLQEFGTVDNLYKHLDEVKPPRVQEKLREHEAKARQSVELARIVTDVPIRLDLEECKRSAFSREAVVELFRELEFSSLLERLPDADGKEPSEKGQVKEVQYTTVTDEGDLEVLLAEAREAGYLAFDTETTSLDAMRAELVGISISTEAGKASYIPVGHQSGDQLPRDVVLSRVKPLLEDPTIEKTAHNANYDMMILGNYDVAVNNLAMDSMVAAALAGEKALGLKALSFERVGIEMTPITALIGTGKKQITMDRVEIGAAAPYAAADADITFRLSRMLEEELKRQGLWKLMTDVEMPLVPVLVRMQRNGIALDTDLLGAMSVELGERMAELEAAIYNSVGHRFNINSSQQLGDILFKELQLPHAKRTKSGFSTDASVLEGLRGVHPIVEYVLEYRQISKLKSTYIDALPSMVNPDTGRVHTTFNQTGSVTGRVSSNDPNLQNVPVRTDLGGHVRNAFIAEGAPNWLLMAADYSQIDLRVLAHISEDPALVRAFQEGEDIHASTASQVYGVPIDQVTPDMRRIAKVINFGVVYGISGYGLASRTELSHDEANAFIDGYFAKYPEVKNYMEVTKRQAKDKGYVETALGRRRYFPEIRGSNVNVRMAAERMAINMPIQGTSAEILKLSMIELQRRMDDASMGSKVLLQVHDELIFEVPKEELEDMATLVQEVMPNALELKVPLKVDIKTGVNWGEMD
ncbi:MAG: DNA polymerase I [Dehalococcoidia bacterium]